MNIDWTADGIVALSGILVSFVFAYFPWIKDWFDTLDSKVKPMVNLGVLAVIVVGRLLIGCDANWECIQSQAPSAFSAFFAALLLNQGTYQIGVRQFKK